MIEKKSQFLRSLLFLLDVGVLSTAWIAAYALRFSGWPYPVHHGVPPLAEYLPTLWFVIPIWWPIFKANNLYRPRRLSRHLRETLDICKASSLGLLILVTVSYLVMKTSFSRVFLIYYWLLATAGLVLLRAAFREGLRFLRRRGFNARQVLIVGTGQSGKLLRAQLERHRELGLQIHGFLTHDAEQIGSSIEGIEVLAHLDDVRRILEERRVDLVFVALPADAHAELSRVIDAISDELVEIKVIPDLHRHFLLKRSVEEFEGLPVITLSGSPMEGWNRIVKRSVDFALSAVLLVLCGPLLMGLALLVKLTSRGPVFYRQVRVGLDGRSFRLIKFRTMLRDAEKETGAIWAERGDPRCTPVGRLLRRTSLDELPQLWHVLRGEMSLVGPRPERPVFIEKFREHIPRYMLRHRVQAGITGWAQVHNWRGNTSIQKRLEYDLYYIEHWSLLLDIKILWLTLWRGFINKNAY